LSPAYPPLQSAPAAPFAGAAPQPILPTSTDPYIRGKLLIKQATDMISGGQLDSAIALLQKSMDYRKVDPTPQFLLGLITTRKAIHKRL